MACFRLGSFSSWNEWLYVKRVLLDLSPKERLFELVHCQDVIAMWRARQHIPHSVDITAEMVDLMMKDPVLSQLHLEHEHIPHPIFFYQDHELTLLYSLTIIRAINGITEPSQQGYYVRSILTIAEELGLPGWIVELRHDATHGHLPSLSVLRAACRYLLTWYEKHYWKPQYEELEKLNKKSMQGSFQKEKVEDCSSIWFSDFLVPCLLSSSLAFTQQLTEVVEVVVEEILPTHANSEVVTRDDGVGNDNTGGSGNEVIMSGGDETEHLPPSSTLNEKEGEEVEARVEEREREEEEEAVNEIVNEERENATVTEGGGDGVVDDNDNDKVISADVEMKTKKKKDKKKTSILHKVRNHIQGWKKSLLSLPQQVLPGALHQLLYGIAEQLVKTSCHLSRLGDESSIDQQAEVLKMDILIEWLLECERLIRSHASRMTLPFLPCLQGLLIDLQSSAQHSTLLQAKIKSVIDILTKVSIRTGSATRIRKDQKRPAEKVEEEKVEEEKVEPLVMMEEEEEEEACIPREEHSEDRKTIDEMEAWLNSISSRPSKRAKTSNNAPVQHIQQKVSSTMGIQQKNEVKKEEHDVTINELRLGEKKDFVSICVDYPIWPMGLLPGRSEAPQLHLIQYDTSTSSQLS
eukprot:gene8867-9779_t